MSISQHRSEHAQQWDNELNESMIRVGLQAFLDGEDELFSELEECRARLLPDAPSLMETFEATLDSLERAGAVRTDELRASDRHSDTVR